MGNKVRLTETRALSLECRPEDARAGFTLWWDTACPHLAVRATQAGAVSYVFQGRLHGHVVRITIGDVRSWQLGRARAEARRLTTLVDQGIDPREVTEQQRLQAEASQLEAKRGTAIFRDAWNTYTAAREEKWSARYRQDHAKLSQAGGVPRRRGQGLTKPGPLAALMSLKLSELTAERVKEWLQNEAEHRPTKAADAFRLLRAFVNWTQDAAEFKGIVPEDACSARSVTDEVPESRAKEGDCLQREQLAAWFSAVRALDNPVISAYLQTLLLTGPRREELAALRWDKVDFAWNSLTIRDKIEGERTIPLTPYVAELLISLPRRNEWVFSSPEAEQGHLTSPNGAHARALQAAGLPHVTLHGLRRSFGTLSEWVEMPVGIAAQIQGHKPSAIAEKHYRRRPLDLLRLWHTKMEAWILEQGEVPFVQPGSRSDADRIVRVAHSLTRHFGREELQQLAEELMRRSLAAVVSSNGPPISP